jgi:hypothetical protein
MTNDYHIVTRAFYTHNGALYEGSRVPAEEYRADGTVVVRDMLGRPYLVPLEYLKKPKEGKDEQQATK